MCSHPFNCVMFLNFPIIVGLFCSLVLVYLGLVFQDLSALPRVGAWFFLIVNGCRLASLSGSDLPVYMSCLSTRFMR